MTEKINASTDQSLTEHLTELRKRIIYGLLGILIAFAVSWNFIDQIFSFVLQPILPFLPEKDVIVTGLTDKFMAHIKVAFLAATISSCPWWIYQSWKFIAPGLYKNEKKYTFVFLFAGSFLFVSGATFVFYVVYPVAFNFLLNFGATGKPMITLENYISFVLLTTLVFGLTFQMPLVMSILGMLGVVKKKFLKEKRPYAIVLIAILSALITPPDPLSMLLLMSPLFLLYEVSIILVGVVGKSD